MLAAWPSAEDEHRDEDADQSDDAEDEESGGGDVGWFEESPDAFDECVGADCEEDGGLGAGGEDLGAAVSPGPFGVGWAEGE